MTPDLKAKELIKKFQTSIAEETMDADNIILHNAKQCALVCANEMIYELSDLPRIPYNERREQFWKDVKTELEWNYLKL